MRWAPLRLVDGGPLPDEVQGEVSGQLSPARSDCPCTLVFVDAAPLQGIGLRQAPALTGRLTVDARTHRGIRLRQRPDLTGCLTGHALMRPADRPHLNFGPAHARSQLQLPHPLRRLT